MHKTLHKKFTDKHHSSYMQAFPAEEALLCGSAQDMKILDAAAKELLQPRPEAIARLLQLAKAL